MPPAVSRDPAAAGRIRKLFEMAAATLGFPAALRFTHAPETIACWHRGGVWADARALMDTALAVGGGRRISHVAILFILAHELGHGLFKQGVTPGWMGAHRWELNADWVGGFVVGTRALPFAPVARTLKVIEGVCGIGAAHPCAGPRIEQARAGYRAAREAVSRAIGEALRGEINART